MRYAQLYQNDAQPQELSAQRPSARKQTAGKWRRRHLAFELLESRRLLSITLSEFPIRSIGGNPQGIASDPADGDVWVTLPNSIDQINPATDTIVQTYPIPVYNSGASLIAYDQPDNDLWFYESAANGFGVLNPAAPPDQAITELPILTNPGPDITGMTVDPKGNIWFTESNFDEIGMLDTADTGAAQFETISQFHLTPGATPYGITFGPNNEIWFTESGLNQIGWISPASHAFQEIPIKGASGTDLAEGITAGPNGTVWFTEAGANQVVMYNPQNATTPFTAFPIPAGARLNAITWGQNIDNRIWFPEPGLGAMGSLAPTSTGPVQLSSSTFSSASVLVPAPDGNYWFNEPGSANVGNFNPTSGAGTQISIPTSSYDDAEGIVSLGGELWFTDLQQDMIGMFDPATGYSTEYALPSSNSVPDQPNQIIAVNGMLWFSETYLNAIGEFNPATDQYTGYQLSSLAPVGITYDQQDGFFWYAEPNQNQIGFLDPTTGASHAYSTGSNTDPTAIVADSNGNLWYTEANANAIGEYTPATTAVNAYGTNSAPFDIIIGPDGNLWFTETYSNQVGTIQLNNKNNMIFYNVPGHDDEGVSSGTDYIAAGPDGNLWYTENAAFFGGTDIYVGSITTSGTNAQLSPTPGNVPALELTAGPDGNVWFTSGQRSPNAFIGVSVLSSTGVGTQLAVTTQPPPDVTAGEPATNGFGLVVSVENSSGQLDTLSQPNQGSVTIQLVPPSGLNNAQITSGTLTEPVFYGHAVFSGLTINDAGGPYQIVATLSGLTPAMTQPFTVTAQATKLAVTSALPASVPAGTVIPLVVEAEDASGHVDASYDGPITVSLTTGTGPLLGTVIVGAIDGTATFSDLSIDTLGSDYRIQADSANLTPAITGPFAVAAGLPALLVMNVEPSATALAGVPLATQPVVYEEDQFGNLVTSDSSTVVTVSLNRGTGPLLGTLTTTVSGGIATFANLQDNTAKTIALSFTSGGLTAAASSAVFVSPGLAAVLSVQTEPSTTAVAGVPLAPQPVIEEEDKYGNLETGDRSTVVTASLEAGAGPLLGELTATVSEGVATFTDLQDNTAGNIVLSFSSGSLMTASSDKIVVFPGTPAALLIRNEPSPAATAGLPLTAQPVIVEEDHFGNVLTDDNSTVITAALASGVGPLQGALTATLVGGVATFTDLADDTAGTITLKFTGAGLASPSTAAIVVSPAAPSQLVITVQPSATAAAGQAFANQPVVEEEDSYNNVETGDDSSVVNALLNSGAGPLQGNTALTVSGGVARFADLADNRAEALSLRFTTGNLTSAPTHAIVVSPAAVSQLVIQTQPSSTATAGAPLTTQPVIDEEDPFGNLDAGDNSLAVTAVLAGGAGPLQGTLTVAALDGVATFTDLADDRAEVTALRFTSGGVTSAATGSIAVTPAVASQLVIAQQPPVAAMAGQAFVNQPVVAVEDAYGNLETSDNSTVVTAALASGTGPLQGVAAVTVDGGVANFASLADNLAETIALGFTAPSLTATPVSGNIVVSPAVPAQLVIQTQPSATATADIDLNPSPVIEEEDTYGNLETSDDSTVITATLATGAGPLLGGTATVDGGVATFSRLADDTAGSLTLNFGGGGLTTGPSNSVAVSPAPASKLVIHTAPSATATAGQPLATQPVIYVEDASDNLETSDNSTMVTASLASGAGLLLGTTGVVVKGGVATFTHLQDDTAGTLVLEFAGGGLAAATSSSITVVAAAPAELIVTQPPVDVTAGVGFGVVVHAVDSYNNLVTAFSGPVTVSLSSSSSVSVTLSGPVTVNAASGVATFTDLVCTTSGSFTLTGSSSTGGLASRPIGAISVSAGSATQLVVTTPPPSSIAPGQTISLVVSVEDTYGNVVPSYNGTVTISLPSDAGLTTTVYARNGLATFVGITPVTAASGDTIQVAASGLQPVTTGPIMILPPGGQSSSQAPIITSEQVVRIQKLNKKGKPAGKPVLEGFALDYSTAMNPATAGLAANYIVNFTTARRVKGKTVMALHPVNVTGSYNPSSNSVTLTIQGKQTFEKGGQIRVIASPPSGVSSAAGALLNADDTVFQILPKAKGITGG